MITVAHRMDVAADADQIALRVDGALVGVVPHETLRARNADYAQLWRRWRAARRGAAAISDAP